MTVFTQNIRLIEQVEQIREWMRQGSPAMVAGLSSVHKSALLAGLLEQGEQDGVQPALVITAQEQHAQRLCDDFNRMMGFEAAGVFPYRDLVIRQEQVTSNEYELARLKLIGKAAENTLRVVFCSVEAACSYTIPKKRYLQASFTLNCGASMEQSELIQTLNVCGYTVREQVDGPGQYAVRGGIVDIFAVEQEAPVRLEYWGDEIDSISFFELDSQRRTESVDCIRVTPATELLISSEELSRKISQLAQKVGRRKKEQKAYELLQKQIQMLEGGIPVSNKDKFLPLIYDSPATILDYFEQPAIFVSEWNDVRQAGKAMERQWREDCKVLLEQGELCRELCQTFAPFDAYWEAVSEKAIYLETFPRGSGKLSLRHITEIQAVQLAKWSGELSFLLEELKNYDNSYTILIMGGTPKSCKTIVQDLNREGYLASFVSISHATEPGSVYVLEGSLSSGFEFPSEKFVAFTHSQTHAFKRRRRPKRKGEEIRSLSDLNPGDLVVHISHGIGRFQGIEKLAVQGVEKDYIKVKYRGADVLYVPVTQLDLISKYIGAEGDGVRLNKMGGEDWKKTCRRVKKEVAEMARQLIRLYAERQNAPGFAFSQDDDWMRSFEQRFEYEETQDQLRAIAEIKQDMQSPHPMDRLLCGDVGFGKTEVALRAAFKCILDGKQCALLCPTTILAMQHYQTILTRRGDFPFQVQLLSRFRTPKQQKEILEQLESGQLDFVVGTHRLVQKDVKFHDLGLAIIDEEQRFGVTQKEKFKEAFRGVDVLSLSATPIPRTLNMAMSGIRDMSVLEEPPQDRQPVQTYVMEYDQGVISQALKKELRRNGQAYYIHNHIGSIVSCAARVQKMAPGARIGIAHGRMNENELSAIWGDLIEHKLDVLVCTAIVETGVDLPNVNTLIVEQADHLGLSQLYQLRGRVGRSKRRAFAYFTFSQGKVLTEVAFRRLEAIREFTRFGSGFRIALRDLEIRGAGSLLGEKQHGQMEAVGYDMYMRILEEAMDEAKGNKPKAAAKDCMIDLPIRAYLPESYISNTSQRLEIYRKIAAVSNQEESLDLTDELIDRFGEPPREVMGLLEISLLRAQAAALGFTEVSFREGHIRFYAVDVQTRAIPDLLERMGNRAALFAGDRPYVSVKLNQQRPVEVMKEVLSGFEKTSCEEKKDVVE